MLYLMMTLMSDFYVSLEGWTRTEHHRIDEASSGMKCYIHLNQPIIFPWDYAPHMQSWLIWGKRSQSIVFASIFSQVWPSYSLNAQHVVFKQAYRAMGLQIQVICICTSIYFLLTVKSTFLTYSICYQHAPRLGVCLVAWTRIFVGVRYLQRCH